MKPLELVGRALKNSSKKDQNILDLFGGSGSTLIACEQIQRNAYLMELDERYVDVIVKRYLRFVQSYDNCYLIRDGGRINLIDIPDYKIEFTDLVQ
jgi:DNA modification methylase